MQNVICIIVCLHVVSPKGGSQLSLVRVLWILLITNIEFVLGGVHFSDQAKLFGSMHEGILLLCSAMKKKYHYRKYVFGYWYFEWPRIIDISSASQIWLL